MFFIYILLFDFTFLFIIFLKIFWMNVIKNFFYSKNYIKVIVKFF